MKPMNLLVIMADELSVKTLGCYGHPVVKTPNIDRLAASGARFTGAYTNSPICIPARASFATGRYVHEIGCWDNASPYAGEPTGWGHRLQAEGRRVTSIGKLHYRNVTDPTGFDEQIVPMHARDGVGGPVASIRDELIVQQADKLAREIGPGETSYTNYDLDIAEKACVWIENEAQKYNDSLKPWMTFVSFVSPHFPLMAPKEYFDMYPLDAVPMPKAHALDGRPRHPWIEAYRKYVPSDSFFDDEKRRVAIASYFGLCTFLDDQVGRVLASLERAGLADSTRVVFASDHGENLGARGTWGKGTMYQESAAVPLMMAGPDIEAGAVVETPVSLLDFYPTILESVGVAPDDEDESRAGRSLYGIARAPDDPERVVFSEYHASGAETAAYLIRKGRKKYIHYVGYPPELYDLATDPEEQDDLAGKPENEASIAELEGALRGILDPEEVDARAKRDQAALIERLGGRDHVIETAKTGATPTPGDYGDDGY
ncbi:MAG: sulfatase-like hydrolase/transferase [Nitrospinae bacterium]|nr:sulfatase-like hydrolase/transferase [Nitrospinota bacterium]